MIKRKMLLRTVSLCLILSFIVLSTFVQAQSEAKVDSLFHKWDKPDVPGGAVGIIKNGELIYAEGYGSADLEHDIEITPATKFYTGSVSKQFVTFCILLLEEQGKLNLDDHIQKYLPDFPEYQAPITIRHLIHHTSGVRDYPVLMSLKGKSLLNHAKLSEVYELIKNQKELNFNPGEQHLYSNSGYLLLAMIVEKAAGKSIREFAKEQIFEPLGMHNTLFYDDISDLIENRVLSYQKTDEGYENLISRFDLVGSGGIYTTIEDLYLWDQNFYDNKLGEGDQKLIEKMHEEGTLNNEESTGYAFALVNDTYKGLKTVSHGGSLAGYRAFYLRFPEQHFSVVILSNRSDARPESMSYKIADLYLEEQFSKSEDLAKTTPPNHPKTKEKDLNLLTGQYFFERTGLAVEVRIKNDSLNVLQKWDNTSYGVSRLYGNTFVIPTDSTAMFQFSEFNNGTANALTLTHNGHVMPGKRVTNSNISDNNPENYEGSYFNEELNVSYNLFVKKNELYMRIGFNEPTKLTPVGPDQYYSTGRFYRFTRNKEGEISGFRLDAGRVQNVRFIKQ